MYEIYERLINELGITTYRVAMDTGIAQSVFSAWKSGKSRPKPDKLKKIANTEKKISRLKELYLNELITMDDYKHDLAAYKADIDGFKEEMKKYKGTDKSALKAIVGRNLADWYWTLTEDERRVIWRSVIDQIYFENDKNIKVVFR